MSLPFDEPTSDPIARFGALLAEAHRAGSDRIPEPTAFALATVGSSGRPSVRMLLLKDATDAGFVFYTNLRSRKGQELAAHPQAALCFHWAPIERQVRVEGTVNQVADAEADAYFATRSRGSQLGAWASLQSEVMATPADLERRLTEIERRFDGGAVPRPPHWSGFRLVPDRIEFWINRPSRLHTRHLYTRAGRSWRIEILYP